MIEIKEYIGENVDNNGADNILDILGHFIDMKKNETPYQNLYNAEKLGQFPDNNTYIKHIKTRIHILIGVIVVLSLMVMTAIVLFVVFYSKCSIIPKIIVCISILALSCLLYILAQRKRRYQNALRKLELLILRLKLGIDKDLKSPYRLDRELEMIYRIIEL